MATRFACGIIFHYYVQSELIQGFNNMKYALNHPWKFERSGLAFFAGFVQVVTVLALESLNYILLMTKNTHRDILISFIAFVIIS